MLDGQQKTHITSFLFTYHQSEVADLNVIKRPLAEELNGSCRLCHDLSCTFSRC